MKLGDKDYVEIRDYPKVILCSPDSKLDDFMEKIGYRHKKTFISKNEKIYEFDNTISANFIAVKEYNNYSIWFWRE